MLKGKEMHTLTANTPYGPDSNMTQILKLSERICKIIMMNSLRL